PPCSRDIPWPTLEHHARPRPELALADLTAEGQAQLRESLPGSVERAGFLLARKRRGQVELVETAHGRDPLTSVGPRQRPTGLGLAAERVERQRQPGRGEEDENDPQRDQPPRADDVADDGDQEASHHQGDVGTDGVRQDPCEEHGVIIIGGCLKHHSPAPSPTSRRLWGGLDTSPTSPLRWSPTSPNGSESRCSSRDPREWARPSWRRPSRGPRSAT